MIIALVEPSKTSPRFKKPIRVASDEYAALSSVYSLHKTVVLNSSPSDKVTLILLEPVFLKYIVNAKYPLVLLVVLSTAA